MDPLVAVYASITMFIILCCGSLYPLYRHNVKKYALKTHAAIFNGSNYVKITGEEIPIHKCESTGVKYIVIRIYVYAE